MPPLTRIITSTREDLKFQQIANYKRQSYYSVVTLKLQEFDF